MIKTDLTTYTNLGREAFPWPGVLKGRSIDDRAAILADPAEFFGDPVDGHDPVPEGTQGFGWWAEVDQSTALAIAEAHGTETLTVDVPGKRWIVTREVIAAPAGAVDAYFEALEATLHAEIEVGAMAARHAVYNPDPTKLEIHRRKREMAEEIDGGAAIDPVKHDYVVEEAALLGVTAPALATSILAKVSAIAAAGKAVELAQTAAEIAVTQTKGDEAAMRAAAVVDWSSLGGA
jgi:hypothetical protein